MSHSEDSIDAELLRGVGERAKDWNQTRSQATRPNFAGADLSGKRMVFYDLSDADLSGANLSGAMLIGAKLKRANLDGADLTGALLGGAKLDHANVRNAILTGADLSDANARSADFRNANLTQAKLDLCLLVDANLAGALIGTNLESAIVEDADVVWPGLSETRIHRLDLVMTALPDHPDRPTLKILIDGSDVLKLKRHTGFLARAMLGESAALLPKAPPRRVAVYCCSCGHAGCGVIAPLITAEGSQIAWRDTRTFQGVFGGPEIETNPTGGQTIGLPDLTFDAIQYRAEVARAVEELETRKLT